MKLRGIVERIVQEMTSALPSLGMAVSRCPPRPAQHGRALHGAAGAGDGGPTAGASACPCIAPGNQVTVPGLRRRRPAETTTRQSGRSSEAKRARAGASGNVAHRQRPAGETASSARTGAHAGKVRAGRSGTWKPPARRSAAEPPPEVVEVPADHYRGVRPRAGRRGGRRRSGRAATGARGRRARGAG